MLLTVITPTADILGNPQEPEIISKTDSQLLYGEQFQVEETHGIYVYGHGVHDGYKGFIEREQLVKDAPAANSFISIKATHLYTEPDFKSRPVDCLGFLSRLPLTQKKEGDFTALENGKWVYTNHTSPIGESLSLTDIALLYLGTPYLYGGRSIWGIDCSGLVQNCLIAKGYKDIPRDSADQEDAFGKPVTKEDLKQNDVVFFKDHVGIMIDNKRILNATERHMSTVIENLEDLEKTYNGITHIARL